MTRKPRLDLDVQAFMRRHWQRRPLLVRRAFASFVDPLSVDEVLALAASPEAMARLVQRTGARWRVEHGPFTRTRFKQLPRRDWTVLVQDTQHFSRRAERLLAAFDFLPHARVDDLMVSYAVAGGGVGPHVDSYDVFLVQGHGRRRWRISRQDDVAIRPGLELKILERFVPEAEWWLEAGDMLYLPPGVAHEGVAEGECLTWSVGFRAPSDRELVEGFLDFLRDRLEPAGRYGDRGARPVRHAGEIPPPMVEHFAHALGRIRWTPAHVHEFAGRHLSEPKAHVFFSPPARPLARRPFAAHAARRGLVLDGRSRLLFSGRMFFLNGEAVRPPPDTLRLLRDLADRRELPAPIAAPEAFWDLLHSWYAQGFVQLPAEEKTS